MSENTGIETKQQNIILHLNTPEFKKNVDYFDILTTTQNLICSNMFFHDTEYTHDKWTSDEYFFRPDSARYIHMKAHRHNVRQITFYPPENNPKAQAYCDQLNQYGLTPSLLNFAD